MDDFHEPLVSLRPPGLFLAVLDLEAGGDQRPDGADELVRRGALFGGDEMPSKRPSLSSSVWAVSMSQMAIVAPPSESTSPKLTMPVTS